ncbi:beta strand repeat-containing protein, partial [Sphingomonas edaphi]
AAIEALDAGETPSDVFTVSVSDGDGPLVTQSYTVNLTGADDNIAPIANSDVIWVSNNTTVTLSNDVLLGNDIDVDGIALILTNVVVTTGLLASPVVLNANGTFTFTTGAAGGTVGTPTVVTLTYSTDDGAGGTTTGSVTVNIITTTSGVDSLNLTAVPAYQASFIQGLAGADTLTDGTGVSTLLGGDGADNLTGNAGNDLLIGGDNNDVLDGGSGNDILRGGFGNNDEMNGGAGSEDLLDFSDGTAAVTFTLVQSAVFTSIANGTGGLGNNDKYMNMEGVIGTSQGDTLTGSANNDILRGGGGNDTLNGGGGLGDLIDFRDGTAGITFTLVQGGGATVFNASAAGLGSDTYSNIEGVIGTVFNDILTGSSGNDILRGDGGNDVINGADGDDTLVGGAGADTITGGLGNDVFVLTTPLNAVDTIVDYSGSVGNADVIDITAILNVPGAVDPINDGYLRVTTTGLLQVDLDGGGNNWITLANINTGVSPTVRYIDGGVITNIVVAPVAPPIALDLDGDGFVSFTGTDGGAVFDYGYGTVSTAWVAGNDGILVRDANGDGHISSNEIVFATTGSDLEGLATYDTNQDGQLSAADSQFAEFGVWQDADSDGQVDAGELQSLAAHSIASISLSSDGVAYSAANGDVQVVGTGSYTRTDGSTGVLADAVFATGNQLAANDPRLAPAAGNTAILAAAAAAVGLASMPAHAQPADSEADGSFRGELQETLILRSHADWTGLSNAASDVSGLHADGLASFYPAMPDPSQMGATPSGSNHSLIGSEVAVRAEAAFIPMEMSEAVHVSSAPVAMAMVAMPSAELLAAAVHGSGAQPHGQVAAVIADAFAGDSHATAIDALLDVVTSQHNADGSGGGSASLAHLASAPWLAAPEYGQLALHMQHAELLVAHPDVLPPT